MILYILVGMLIFFFGILSQNLHYKRKLLFLVSLMLILFFGLRGDFTADYSQYLYLFNYYHRTPFLLIMSVESVQEIGFVIITKLLSYIVSYQVYLLVLGIIIVGCYMRGFSKTSTGVYIAIMLWYGFGGYLGSFNTTRQALAASILFAGSSYLYERNFKKYLVFIILAAIFHLTAIVMIPCYFLFSLKVDSTIIIRYIILGCVMLIGINVIVETVIQVIPRFRTYRIGEYGLGGGSLGYMVPVMVMGILVFVISRSGGRWVMDHSDYAIRAQMNALGVAFIVSAISTRMFLIDRLNIFFLPHICVLVSNMWSGCKNRKNKLIIMIGITGITLGYIFVSLRGSGYDPYYFFWQR